MRLIQESVLQCDTSVLFCFTAYTIQSQICSLGSLYFPILTAEMQIFVHVLCKVCSEWGMPSYDARVNLQSSVPCIPNILSQRLTYHQCCFLSIARTQHGFIWFIRFPFGKVSAIILKVVQPIASHRNPQLSRNLGLFDSVLDLSQVRKLQDWFGWVRVISIRGCGGGVGLTALRSALQWSSFQLED